MRHLKACYLNEPSLHRGIRKHLGIPYVLTGMSDSCECHLPPIITDGLGSTFCYRDGELRVTESPIPARENSLAEDAKIVEGTCGRDSEERTR